MLKSQWQELFWTACTPHFESPSEGLNIAAFDKEKYPALKQLEELHYLELLMLAYSILLTDTVSDDFVDEPLTGELLFEELTSIGNVELGIQALVQKGFLKGECGGEWMKNVYEVNLKKLAEDGLLTSCERLEVSEEELLPVGFPAHCRYGEQTSLLKSWINLCHHIYWYSFKEHDWVVYVNLEKLCRVFMNRWQLSYPELRVLAIASHKGGLRWQFTEEEVVEHFHPAEISRRMVQDNFEKLVGRGVISLAGFNEEEAYLFKIDPVIYSDPTRYRLHYNEEEGVFSLHPSALPLEHWEEIYKLCLDLVSQGSDGIPPEGFFGKEYPALRYIKLSLKQLVLLSYFITEEAAQDKDKNKFFSLTDLFNHFFEYGEKHGCTNELYDLWNTDRLLMALKDLEDRHWVSILTSTYQTQHYAKLQIQNLVEDGLLQE